MSQTTDGADGQVSLQKIPKKTNFKSFNRHIFTIPYHFNDRSPSYSCFMKKADYIT